MLGHAPYFLCMSEDIVICTIMSSKNAWTDIDVFSVYNKSFHPFDLYMSGKEKVENSSNASVWHGARKMSYTCWKKIFIGQVNYSIIVNSLSSRDEMI